MSSTSPHLSSLDLDLLALAPPGAGEAAPFLDHLDACEGCRQRQQARQAIVDHFHREVLPPSLPVLRQRLAARSRRLWGWWGLALSPVGAGLLFAIFTLRQGAIPTAPVEGSQPGSWSEPGDFGTKGDRELLTYVRRGNQVTRLASGGVVAPGDALRFVVETGSHRFVFIAGVDGGGQAHAYYPFGEWRSVPVPPRSRFEVPGSLVLDNAPGPERIFALVSAHPVDGDKVRAMLEGLAQVGPPALRNTATLDLLGAEISSILFEKRE